MKDKYKIKFLGASGTVTGSGYFLHDSSGRGILIDLGMFQGKQQEERLNKLPLELDVSKVDAVILTHAHLDHCGRLPLLTQKGYRGKIYAVAATRELVEIVLRDSAKIASFDPTGNPLYTKEDVENLLPLFENIQYHSEFKAGNFTVTAFDAGHLLGSCSFIVTDGKKKIIFSGDLGNSPQTLVKATEFIESGDVVIEETTYGDRGHPKEDSLGMLQNEINKVEETGGALLIPSFSLNRTQDLLYKVKVLKREKKVKDSTPVFMDSPMADAATVAHLKHRYLFNNNLLSETKKGDPFSFPGLKIKRKRGRAKSLKNISGPRVIIAGSGMMSGGRIVSHSKDFLPDRSTRLFIVGYQGEGTMGRELEEGAKEVTIDDTKVEVNATVTKAEAMSSHAGRNSLLNWLSKVKGAKKIILTHGDNPARESYEKLVKEKLGISDIVRPNINEEHFI